MATRAQFRSSPPKYAYNMYEFLNADLVHRTWRPNVSKYCSRTQENLPFSCSAVHMCAGRLNYLDDNWLLHSLVLIIIIIVCRMYWPSLVACSFGRSLLRLRRIVGVYTGTPVRSRILPITLVL